jgi:ABC-type branched-subunit amino acid transport system ATPase component
VRRDERDRLGRAATLLDELGLSRHANDLAEVLSGGQLKLLSIGIALAMESDTLLLDEPTAGVNPVLIDRILELLQKRRDQERTTLIIEHNIPVLATIADSIYVLHAGKIIAHGTPAQVQADELVVDAYLGRRVRVRR